jgi:hypothetical protein
VQRCHLQDLPVEKKQSIEGLVLSRSRDVFIYGEVGKKSAHCLTVKFAGVAFVMEKDESLYPVCDKLLPCGDSDA